MTDIHENKTTHRDAGVPQRGDCHRSATLKRKAAQELERELDPENNHVVFKSSTTNTTTVGTWRFSGGPRKKLNLDHKEFVTPSDSEWVLSRRPSYETPFYEIPISESQTFIPKDNSGQNIMCKSGQSRKIDAIEAEVRASVGACLILYKIVSEFQRAYEKHWDRIDKDGEETIGLKSKLADPRFLLPEEVELLGRKVQRLADDMQTCSESLKAIQIAEKKVSTIMEDEGVQLLWSTIKAHAFLPPESLPLDH
ncbi:MAG: hypothetical protein M1827_006653 [Pycnora praestabilis]|nr:MAG: hypothetical protein M1827_006653 [Pycnora praestabilis]